MVIIGGTVRVPVENVGEVRGHLETLVKATRGEPGCLHYAGAFDLVEPGVVNIFEVYADETAFQAHLGSAHMAAWRAAAGPLGLGERNLTAYAVHDHRKL